MTNHRNTIEHIYKLTNDNPINTPISGLSPLVDYVTKTTAYDCLLPNNWQSLWWNSQFIVCLSILLVSLGSLELTKPEQK